MHRVFDSTAWQGEVIGPSIPTALRQDGVHARCVRGSSVSGASDEETPSCDEACKGVAHATVPVTREEPPAKLESAPECPTAWRQREKELNDALVQLFKDADHPCESALAEVSHSLSCCLMYHVCNRGPAPGC